MVTQNRGHTHWREKRNHLLSKVKTGYENGENVLQMSKVYGASRRVINSCLDDLGLERPTVSATNRSRFQAMTDEQRKEVTATARKIMRSSARAQYSMELKAKRDQASLRYVGKFEREMAERLDGRELEVIPQYAWGRYNFDLFVNGVAVEIHSGAARPFYNSSNFQKTIEAVCAGISIMYIWMRPVRSVTDIAVENVIAFIDESSRNPPTLGQHRVVRSNGEVDQISSEYLDDFALVAARYHALKSGDIDLSP